MVARRTSPPPLYLGHEKVYEFADGRTIHALDEASVLLPGRTTRTRARFRYADGDLLTFADPRNGGFRTVHARAVGTIHRKLRLR